MNHLLSALPPAKRDGLRIVDIMVIRPSQDLRTLAQKLEPKLPLLLRYMIRGLGTRESTNPDFLSLILFQADYIQRLIELGQSDAEAYSHQIEAFLEQPRVRGGAA